MVTTCCLVQPFFFGNGPGILVVDFAEALYHPAHDQLRVFNLGHPKEIRVREQIALQRVSLDPQFLEKSRISGKLGEVFARNYATLVQQVGHLVQIVALRNGKRDGKCFP